MSTTGRLLTTLPYIAAQLVGFWWGRFLVQAKGIDTVIIREPEKNGDLKFYT
jgi:hypothetical protein